MLRSKSNLGTGFILFSVAAFFAMLITGYTMHGLRDAKQTALTGIDHSLLRAVQTVPYLVSTGFFDRAVQAGAVSEEEDGDHIKKLTRMVDDWSLHRIYTLIYTGGHVYITSSSATADELRSHTEARYFTAYPEAEPQMHTALKGKIPVFVTYTDRRGTFRRVYIPMHNAQNIPYLIAADQKVPHVPALLDPRIRETVLASLFLILAGLPFLIAYQLTRKQSARQMKMLNQELKADLEVRNRTEHALRESEEQLRITLNSIGDAMISTDLNGRVVRMNPVAEALTGWSQTEAAGRPLEEVFKIINEQTRNPVENPAHKVLAEGKIVGLANHTLLIAKDGRETPIADSGAPIKDAAGNITGVVLVFRDQTAEKETQKALSDSARHLKALNLQLEEDVKIRKQAEGALQAEVKAQAALIEERSRVEQILNAVQEGWWENDFRTGACHYSATMFTMLGYPPLEGREAYDFFGSIVHPDDMTALAPVMQKMAKSQVVYIQEFRMKAADDSWHYISSRGICVASDERGSKYVGTHNDITERKQLQQALEKRIVALTRPLDQAGNVAFEDLFDIKEIQRIQDEFAAATGVSSIITLPDGTPITQPSNFTRLCSEIIRKTEKGESNCFKFDSALEQYHPDSPVIKTCLSGGLWVASVSVTVGDRHIANWQIGQVRDETQTEEKMLAYAREIGADEVAFIKAFRKVPVMPLERFKQTAKALFTLARQLSTSAYQNIQQARFIADEKRRTDELHRLSIAIEQSSEGIEITDLKGIIEYVNPAFERITGYRREEVIGKNPGLLKSGQHTDEFYLTLWKTIQAGSVWEGRLVNQRKNGEIYTEEASISPVRDRYGAISGYVGIKRDITEELAREEQFRQSQKMEAVGQLAGGIAHDFNNILQVILGFSELLLLTLKENETSRQNVLEIQKAARHAADLTRELLTFSRNQPAEFALLDIDRTVTATEKILTSVIGENIRMKTDLQTDLPAAKADLRQIERVIINLAINARDAMPDGGELTLRTDCVTFSAKTAAATPKAYAGQFICLSVSDTGIGMPDEIKQHIFEPFFSTKAPGKGTGLGLAAAYGIIEQHKGWINVYSEKGYGSTFKVYLPVYTKTEKKQETPPDHAEEISSSRGSGERILVVEDDPAILQLSLFALQNAGYQVKSASNTAEAKKCFQEAGGNFALLMSDIILPDGNGAELAKTFLKETPGLPILLCSGYSGDRIQEAGLTQQGFFYLGKPFSIADLLKTVHLILQPKVQ